MPVAIAAVVIGLVVVLVAYYRDDPVSDREVVAPGWDLLPDSADVARTEFPLSFPGYDPATVELHFETLARAYGDLLAAATPDVLARARHRAALRRGDADLAAPPPRAAEPIEQPSSLRAFAQETPDAEALRAEAALADLDAQHGAP